MVFRARLHNHKQLGPHVHPAKERPGFTLAFLGKRSYGEKSSTQLYYFATIPALRKLQRALVANSSFNVSGRHVDFAKSTSYVEGVGGFPWIGHRTVETDTLGRRWQKLLHQFEHDLPLAWSELADAHDLSAAVADSNYWVWQREIPGKLFTLLHQKQWDEALENVYSWREHDINRFDSEPQPGKWTAQEELDNAIMVVTDYVNNHS